MKDEILTEDSKQVDVKNVKIKLFPHQKAILFKMIQFEKISERNDDFNIFTLKDNAGAGKSYPILALVLHEKRLYGKTQNLFVVPGNIHRQWIDYINNFTSELTVKSLTNYGDVTALYHSTSILREADILITTSVFYNALVQSVDHINFTFNRVILDEIDSMSFFTQIKIPSRKIWLVSATADLMSSENVYNKVSQFSIKCNQNFIEKSINLPVYHYHRYNCVNQNLHLLNGLISQAELEQVNALSYKNFTFNFTNVTNIGSVKELVQAIFKDNYNEMTNLEQKTVEYISQLSPNQPFRILRDLREKELRKS